MPLATSLATRYGPQVVDWAIKAYKNKNKRSDNNLIGIDNLKTPIPYKND